MVRTLRQAKPAIRFNLEVITRDALEVPALTPGYWATFPDVPARDLATTLAAVKAHAGLAPFPVLSREPPEAQLKAELRNVEVSLAYARDRLGL